MYHETLQKIGLKRLPPILLPLAFPFVLIVILGALLYELIYWMLGFWRCCQCNKTYWIIHDRKSTKETVDDLWKQHICDACTTMNELTNTEEPRGAVPGTATLRGKIPLVKP